MVDAGARAAADEQRLQQFGYRQELSRVLSLFDNFSVAFAYLSPVVGIYSLFAIGAGTGGPAYIWTIPVVVLFMLLVAMVFGELGSHYPVSGALYQYGKYSVGPGYGWWIGWIYGVALLATVASVDTGVVSYITVLTHRWFNWNLNPASHAVILWITVVFVVLQFVLNSIGARVMGHVARVGVYVETIGTFGVAIALGIHGFHHGFGFLFKTEGVQNAATNPLGANFGGHWLTGAALIAVLASVYIFYGFESAGDIGEETKQASRQIPISMRRALIYGGSPPSSSSQPCCSRPLRHRVRSRMSSPTASLRSSRCSRRGSRTSSSSSCASRSSAAEPRCRRPARASPMPTAVTAHFPGPRSCGRSRLDSRPPSTPFSSARSCRSDSPHSST